MKADLAVLGFFIDVDDSLPAKGWMDYTLDDLIHNNIRNANDQVNIDWSADTMLPKNLKDQGFWRYEGKKVILN